MNNFSFQDLLQKLQDFQKERGLVNLSHLPEEPVKALQDQVERTWVKKGKMLCQAWQSLQEEEQKLAEKKAEIKQACDALKKETVQTIDLPSGERLTLDISNGKRCRALSQELEMFSFHKPRGLYDEHFLSAESDELLSFL